MTAPSIRHSPAATQSRFPFTREVLGGIATGGDVTGELAGFSTEAEEGAGVSAILATEGGTEDAGALRDEFVEGFSVRAAGLSMTGFEEGVAATKDCGLMDEPFVGEAPAKEAVSAWGVIEDGPWKESTVGLGPGALTPVTGISLRACNGTVDGAAFGVTF